MDRKNILEAAINCVCHDRQDVHGSPEQTMEAIADFWSVYLSSKFDSDICIDGKDASAMMVLFKIARHTRNHNNLENPIDCCGYSAILGELISKGIQNGEMEKQKRD